MPEDTRPLDRVRLARRPHDPRRAVARRVGFALLLIAFIALVVLVGRDGYTDVTGDPVGLIDALYYASVTVTTTGYGDISAVTTATRLATVLLITPARIIFLILVVGTTVEVLTEQYRQLLAVRRWREDVQDHFVICGFGATGRSAARALQQRGERVGLAGEDFAILINSEHVAVVRGKHRGNVDEPKGAHRVVASCERERDRVWHAAVLLGERRAQLGVR